MRWVRSLMDWWHLYKLCWCPISPLDRLLAKGIWIRKCKMHYRNSLLLALSGTTHAVKKSRCHVARDVNNTDTTLFARFEQGFKAGTSRLSPQVLSRRGKKTWCQTTDVESFLNLSVTYGSDFNFYFVRWTVNILIRKASGTLFFLLVFPPNSSLFLARIIRWKRCSRLRDDLFFARNIHRSTLKYLFANWGFNPAAKSNPTNWSQNFH